MVNSSSPHYSNLVSDLHRNYLFMFKFSHHLDQTGTWWLCCANGLQTCSVSTPRRPGSYYGEIVQLQSAFKDRVTTVFQEKSKTDRISEPKIIIRFFSKTCASSFTSEQFLLLSFAKKRCTRLKRFWRLFRLVT